MVWAFGSDDIEGTLPTSQQGATHTPQPTSGAISSSQALRRVFALALPISGSQASQYVLDLMVTAIVAPLGPTAVGAIGLGMWAHRVVACFACMGMQFAVQVVVARRAGENNKRGAVAALNVGFLLVPMLIAPAALLLSTQAGGIFALLSNDADVVAVGTSFLTIRLYALCLESMEFAFRGFWYGLGRPGIAIRAVLCTHGVWLFLSWVFILGKFGCPAMGTDGAAIAAVVAQPVGIAIHYLAARHYSGDGFLRHVPQFKLTVTRILRLIGSSGTNMFSLFLGVLLFYRIAAMLGTTALAANHVVASLSGTVQVFLLGFGGAAATLVGQSLGQKDPVGAKRWAWRATVISVVVGCVAGIPFAVAPSMWIGLLMDNPSVVAVAVAPLIWTSLTYGLDAWGGTLSQALLGAGAARAVMNAGLISNLFIGVPLCYLAAVFFGEAGLVSVWVGRVIWKLVFTAVIMFLFHRGRWTSVRF
ncbi:MATE family efflux transporter [Myxococcota bacterium]